MPANRMQPDKEKRVFPRFQSYIPVAYRVLDEQKSVESLQERRKKIECVMTLDMSLGGMRFAKSDSLKAGHLIQLYFKLPNRGKLFKTFSKVAWNGGSGGGLKYVLVTDEDRNRTKSYLEKIFSA